jgi:hypothetical protein
MKRILLILTIVLISSCKSENKKENNLTLEREELTSEISRTNDKFQAFIEQFPTKTLPLQINGCEILDLPKLNFKLSSEYATDSEYEHIYGIIPSNGNYISTITLGQADCFIPVLSTYKLNGEKIDSKPIGIGYCGPDPCYDCVENMTINSEYQIYVVDTMKIYDCDTNYNEIAGTEKIKVVYKEGKLTKKGIIELTNKIEKNIK